MGVVLNDWRLHDTELAEVEDTTTRVGSQIDRSLLLLRNTRQKVSLFKIAAVGLEPNALSRVVEVQFGNEALVEKFSDGSVMALFFRSEDAIAGLETRVRATMSAALPAFGFRSAGPIDVRALHRESVTISDLSDLLCELDALDECFPAGLFH